MKSLFAQFAQFADKGFFLNSPKDLPVCIVSLCRNEICKHKAAVSGIPFALETAMRPAPSNAPIANRFQSGASAALCLIPSAQMPLFGQRGRLDRRVRRPAERRGVGRAGAAFPLAPRGLSRATSNAATTWNCATNSPPMRNRPTSAPPSRSIGNSKSNSISPASISTKPISSRSTPPPKRQPSKRRARKAEWDLMKKKKETAGHKTAASGS